MWDHLICLITYNTKIIQLQSNEELKARYNRLPRLEFCKCYISNDEVPTLRRHALTYASVFRTAYCCKQFFSEFSITESTALQTDLRKPGKAVASSNITNTSSQHTTHKREAVSASTLRVS
uniref:Uncharacterized protein n=1 Tax=Molossus molossus TaxID=27622 RepID=A0A7J8JW31_MOLMO|nr:hypothetical protein HJG59_008044 [Molossus molossus]